MNSQIIGFNANATMEDLGDAIMEESAWDFIDHDEAGDHAEDPSNDVYVNNKDENEESVSSSTLWPPKVDEFVVALLDDGFYIGLVNKKVEDKKVYLNFLAPKESSDRQYWVWPDREDNDLVEVEYIMEIYPLLRVEMKLSTRRKIVYELLNLEIIEVMLQYC